MRRLRCGGSRSGKWSRSTVSVVVPRSGDVDESELVVLHSVTLGMAKAEIDYLICRCSLLDGRPHLQTRMFPYRRIHCLGSSSRCLKSVARLGVRSLRKRQSEVSLGGDISGTAGAIPSAKQGSGILLDALALCEV